MALYYRFPLHIETINRLVSFKNRKKGWESNGIQDRSEDFRTPRQRKIAHHARAYREYIQPLIIPITPIQFL